MVVPAHRPQPTAKRNTIAAAQAAMVGEYPEAEKGNPIAHGSHDTFAFVKNQSKV